MPKRFNYALKFKQLRAARGNACECGCGRTERLEFAHLRETKVFGRGRGRADRYHDIRRNPDAYALLAKVCHQRQETDRAVQRIKARAVFGETLEREPGDDTGQEDA